MVKKMGLGKGIGALIPAPLPVVEDKAGKKFFSCPIEEIKPNKEQPRKTFVNEKLEELAASIREKGIIQPLVVLRREDHYEIIAGERRWRAAQKAGLREVPVVIQDVSEDTALEMALIENIQREDLNAVEEAEAYHALLQRFDLSQEELAKRVGKERSTIANALRLLRLPAEIKRDKPSLPDVIRGGAPNNPMGVAAMTLSGGEYAIHGTNAPGSIGGYVSYGCIRMYNEDITDLYARVRVGTRVVVMR